MTSARLWLGLDFGTTYSGIAFCDEGHAGRGTSGIEVISDWPGLSSTSTKEKIPSRLSYNPDGTVLYGDEIKPTHRHEVHSCMKLKFDQGTSALASELEKLSFEGLGYSGRDVVDLCADYLRELRRHAQIHLQQRFGEEVYNSMNKELVITVPAVWSERAKHWTLEAVKRAGIDATKLTLVTEPEAAAIYTLNQMMEGANKTELHVGDSVVLCDAGGGTVDLITYVVQSIEPFRLEEATVGAGDKIPASKTRPGSKLMDSFAILKNNFDGRNDPHMTVDLPTECGLDDNAELNIQDRELTITTTQMKRIFDGPVKRTLELVAGQIAIMQASKRKPKLVLVVGGFGRNAYLFQRIRSSCQCLGIETRRPLNEWSAVVRGAVCCGVQGRDGLDKSVVKSRRARKWYGICVQEPFDFDRHHVEDFKVDEYSSRCYATGQFRWFVAKGDQLPAALSEQKKIEINLSLSVWAKDFAGSRSKITLWGYHGNKPPSRKAEADEKLHQVVLLHYELSSISILDLEHYTSTNPTQREDYFEIGFAIEATFSGAEILFRFLHKGKVQGSVKANYDD